MVTLVLLHAFPLSGAMYAADAAALGDRARVLAPTMRGRSVDAMADGVAELLDREEVREPVVVAGVSMGGYVSLAFARRHAARLRGLVLADTRAEPDGDEARKGRDAAIAKVSGGDLAGLVDGMLDKLVGPARRDEVRAIALAQPKEAVVDALHALRDRPDARPGLSAVRVPTLVVVGADDTLTPPPVAETLHAGIEGSELVVLPGARHLSNLDQPDAFRGAVASLLARV